MSKSAVTIKLSGPLMHDASVSAERAGVPVSTWIRDMVAARIRDEQITERFFRRRARAGNAAEIIAILDKAPNVPPISGDELEP